MNIYIAIQLYMLCYLSFSSHVQFLSLEPRKYEVIFTCPTESSL